MPSTSLCASAGATVDHVIRDLERAIRREFGDDCNFVSGANFHDPDFTQETLGRDPAPVSACQCADHTPNKHAKAHQIAGRAPLPHAANLPTTPNKTRKPRRRAADLDHITGKSWRTLTRTEKAAAAIRHVALAGGSAVSLNLGIRREASLLNHEDPRRLFQKHLNKHLVAAGLRGLPFALAFEVTPEASGSVRLHVHGAIETAHLTRIELDRLHDALRRAASFSSGAIGGERQLDMRPIHDAAGWIDYVIEDQAKTRREMNVDDIWLLSQPMLRRAKETFEGLRQERMVA